MTSRATSASRRGVLGAALSVLLLLLALVALPSAAISAPCADPALGVPAPAGHTNGPRSLAVWGTKGSGPGQFLGPMGIDVGPEGVYVTDRGNSRVQVFNADGGLVREIGKYGDATGEFLSIARIHVGTLGDLYISEDNGRIQKFFEDGRVRRYGGSGAGNGLFDGACGITVDYASGLVYVVDTKNCRVQKLDQFGDFRGAWGTKGSREGQFNSPTGIAGTYGVFYVVDSGNSRIQEMSDDGAVRRVFGRPGDGDGELNEPMGVALDRDDNVYVADTGNDRVVVFDRSGDFITQWKVTGGSDAEGRFVADIAVDSDGNVYVIDTVQNYVQKFGPISTSTDGTPPTTKVRVEPADVFWHRKPVTLTFSATDNAGGSGVDFTEYKVDDGGWTQGTRVTVPTPKDHSADGAVVVKYRSVDRAGNIERFESEKVYIDTTAPEVDVYAASVAHGKRAVVKFDVFDYFSSKFRVVATVETSSGRVLHRARSGWIDKKGGANGWGFNANFPTGAFYRVKIVAYDLAGNRSKPGEARLIVY
jgi:DNA-binding beta-propeller fold protein YncE